MFPVHTSTLLFFHNRLDVASVGVPVGMHAMQVRIIPNRSSCRLSSLLGKILNVPNEGWIHGACMGHLFFVETGSELSGEISILWKEWAAERAYDLWTLSFSGAYCGYFSPDKYYLNRPLNYETGLMSWYGPNIEAYFTDLFHKLFKVLRGNLSTDFSQILMTALLHFL